MYISLYLGKEGRDSQGPSSPPPEPEAEVGRLDALFGRLVDIVVGLRWLVLLGCVALAALSAGFASRNLSINTDTADLLSSELPFRKAFAAYRDAFPQFRNTLAVVIDADSHQAALDAAETLDTALKARPDLFQTSFYAAAEPFFRRNGLLYLKQSELDALSDRLSGAQPFLGTLAQDPSLRGLFSVLGTVFGAIAQEEGPIKQLKPFLARVTQTVEAAARGERRPLNWARTFYPEGPGLADRRQVIVVQPKLDFGSLKPAQEAMTTIRRNAAEKGLTPANGVRVRLTGAVAIDNEELDSVARGATVAGIVSMVLVTLLLFAGLRSLWLVGGVLLTLVLGLVLTAGFAALAFGSLNLISVAFAVPFIGLAVDFGIHYCLRFEEAAQADQPARAALRSAARSVGRALALSAAAAAAAFFAFVPTDYRGVAELGMLAGVGVLIAFVLSLTFLPAVLALRPRWRQRVPSPAEGFVVARLVRIEKGIKRRGKAITIAAVIAGFVAFAIAPAARFDHNPMNLKDPTTESVATAIDLRRDTNLGADAVQVLAKDRAQVEALVPRLEKLSTVKSVRTLDSFVPADQKPKLEVINDLALLLGPVLNIDKPRPPPTVAQRRAALRELEAKVQAALKSGKADDMAPLLERLGSALRKIDAAPDADVKLARLERDVVGALPRQLASLAESLKAKPVTLKSLPDSIRDRYVSPEGIRRIEVIPKGTPEGSGALRRFVDQVAAVVPTATGAPVFELRAGDAIVDAYLEATLIAFVLISLMVFAVLRRLLTTVLVLTPVFLAGAFTLAVCALVGPELNFANIIVLPLLIGLGAAGGIHIVKRADRSGGADLVHTSTPRAVLFSALTTLASFGALALSSHRGTASMGELLFIAIFFTLICSLFFLPAMIAYVLGQEPAPGRDAR